MYEAAVFLNPAPGTQAGTYLSQGIISIRNAPVAVTSENWPSACKVAVKHRASMRYEFTYLISQIDQRIFTFLLDDITIGQIENHRTSSPARMNSQFSRSAWQKDDLLSSGLHGICFVNKRIWVVIPVLTSSNLSGLSNNLFKNMVAWKSLVGWNLVMLPLVPMTRPIILRYLKNLSIQTKSAAPTKGMGGI